MTTMFGEEHGAGLAGAITGFIIFAGFGSWLIYSGSKKPEDIISINPNNDTKPTVYNDKYEEKLDTLRELKNNEILTFEEYSEKSGIIKKEQEESELKQSDDYRKLKSLLDENILTKEEIEQKLKILSKRPTIPTPTTIKVEPVESIDYTYLRILLGIVLLIAGIFLFNKVYKTKDDTANTTNSYYDNTSSNESFVDSSSIDSSSIDRSFVDTFAVINTPEIYDEQEEIIPLKNSELTLDQLYVNLADFINLRREYFQKGLVDFESLKRYGLLTINENIISLSDTRVKYLNGEEMSNLDSQFKKMKYGNYVYFGCSPGQNCIYDTETKSYGLGMIQPLETKEECIRLIDLIKEIKERIKTNSN